MNEKQLRYREAVRKYLNNYFINLNDMQKKAVFQTYENYRFGKPR